MCWIYGCSIFDECLKEFARFLFWASVLCFSLCLWRGLLGQVAAERAPRALKPKTTAETFKEKQTKDYVSESDDDGGGDDENHKKHMEI